MIIESIIPHPSEDDLDVVTLGPGTKCVVHKGQFKPGDSVKFVPVKTVKKGIICHGLIAHEDNYMESDTVARRTTVIVHPSVLDNPIPDIHYDGGLREMLEASHTTDPDALEDMNPDYNGDPLSMAEVFSGSEDILERVHSEDPDGILREVYIDDVEENVKIDED